MVSPLGTFRPQLHSIPDILHAITRDRPDSAFLQADQDVFVSYRVASVMAEKVVAQSLTEHCVNLGLVPATQPKVAIISPNGPLLPLTLWASWYIGAIPCLLNAKADPSLWAAMVRRLDPHIVLVVDSHHRRLLDAFHTEQVTTPIIVLESLIPTRFSVPRPREILIACIEYFDSLSGPYESDISPFVATAETSALVVFTSSGVNEITLKAVTYSHAVLIQSGRRTLMAFGGSEYASTPKTHLGWLPLSHAFEFSIAFIGIVIGTGGSYVFHDPGVSSPQASATAGILELLLSALDYYRRVDTLCTIPAILTTQYAKLNEAQIHLLKSLKTLCVAGAPTPDDLFDWARSKAINIIDLIGATEVAGGLATCATSHSEGFVIMDGLFGVLQKDQLDDDRGELILSGQHLPSTYLHGQGDAFSSQGVGNEITAYRTGDIYYQCPLFEGLTILKGQPLPSFDSSFSRMSGISYIGRMDDLIVLASGLKVDAVALEGILDNESSVKRSAIVPSADRNALIALIEPSPDIVWDEKTTCEVSHRINHHLLADHRIALENFVLVDELPMSSKSVLHRKALKNIMSAHGDRWPSHRTLLSISTTRLDVDAPITSNISFDTDAPLTSNAPFDIDITTLSEVETILGDVFNVPLVEVQDHSRFFGDLPLSSLAMTQLAGRLQSDIGSRITVVELYSVRRISDLIQLINSKSNPTPIPAFRPPIVTPRSIGVGLSRIAGERIVISGASCTFPGGINTLDSLWDKLIYPESFGRTLAKEAPASRWTPQKNLASGVFGWLDDVSLDNANSLASFFGIPPVELEAMPPNTRLVMQMGYKAIQDAGVAPSSLNKKDWGIFTSMNESGWKESRAATVGLDEYSKRWVNGTDDSAGARLSYFLDLTGPAMEIKTACSSSAVAIHQACLAIENGDCSAAIVIAAMTNFSPSITMFRSYAGIASPLGRCATFSSDADGFLPSEGAAALVLQREADVSGPIYARIRATALAQDGRSQGFAAPNPDAQSRLLSTGLRKAGLTPDDVSYLEAHGTGTRVGDAIEFTAIHRVYGEKRSRPLLIGSVKAVIGHTEECAGLAGVLKGLLCFKHGVIPPQPHIKRLNPDLHLSLSKAVIPRTVHGLPNTGSSRVISVSSFGLSGTLANIILEESSEQLPSSQPTTTEIFLLSTESVQDFPELLKSFALFSESSGAMTMSLSDFCRTSQIGRDHWRYRRAWVLDNWDMLCTALTSSPTTTPTRCLRSPTVALWFTLPTYSPPSSTIQHPLYVAFMDSCIQNGCKPELEGFARQLAFARTLQSLGVTVSAAGGEGVAEYLAAAFSGVIDDSTLFRILSQLTTVDECTYIVKIAPETLDDFLISYSPQELRIVGRYGPDTVCVSGSSEAVHSTMGNAASGTWATDPCSKNRVLTSSNFPSSSSMSFALRAPAMPLVTSHLGEVMEARYVGNEAYWLGVPNRNFDAHRSRQTLFAKASTLVTISELPAHLRESLYGGGVSSVNAGNDLATVTARLYELGCQINWQQYASPGPTAHIPTYIWANNTGT